MLARFFLQVITFVLAMLVILGMFVCFGCGAGEQDTSIGKFRSMEQANLNHHQFWCDKVIEVNDSIGDALCEYGCSRLLIIKGKRYLVFKTTGAWVYIATDDQ